MVAIRADANTWKLSSSRLYEPRSYYASTSPRPESSNTRQEQALEHFIRTCLSNIDIVVLGGGILQRGKLLLLISALRLPVVHLTLAGVARSSVPNPEIPNPKTLTKRRTYCNGSSHSYGQPRSASPDRHMRTKVIKYSSHRPGIRACVSSSLGN